VQKLPKYPAVLGSTGRCDTCPAVPSELSDYATLKRSWGHVYPERKKMLARGRSVVAHDLARHHDRRIGRLHRGWWRRTSGRRESETRTIERTDGDSDCFAADASVTLPIFPRLLPRMATAVAIEDMAAGETKAKTEVSTAARVKVVDGPACCCGP
jgi:hypothetical protein